MSFGVTELIIIAVIVLLLFGTSKLKSMGGDLGSAIKGFRSAMGDGSAVSDKEDSKDGKEIKEDNPKLQADEAAPSELNGDKTKQAESADASISKSDKDS